MGLRGIVKFCSMRAFEAIVVILLITFIPNIPPNVPFSKPYSLKPPLKFEGKLALNNKLDKVEFWHKGDMIGPEAFAEYNGELYTSVHSGDIVKLTGNHITPVAKFGKPCKGVYQEHICGRPLGFKFDKSGALYVADAYYGIFKVDVKTGKQLQLVSSDQEIEGKKPKLPNSITLASNGDIYWTDSSAQFHLLDGIFDFLSDGSGRLIHYDTKTKQNTVLLNDLHFANGVMLSRDESFIIISETARNRIHRYYLKGPKKGTSDLFLEGLPGLPDNIQSDGQGGFLIPLVIPQDSSHPVLTQILGPFPLVRKFCSRVLGLVELGFKMIDQVYPNEWAERGVHYVGHFTSMLFLISAHRTTVLHVSENGEILDTLHTLQKHISNICEAFIFKDHLYLGSPFNDYIGRIRLDQIGMKHLIHPKKQSSDVPKIKSTIHTEVPKTTTPTPTVAPKTTQSTTEVPKTTQPPTAKTTPPTVASKPSTTTTATPKTSPPTVAPKTTPPPPTTTAAPKTTSPPTTAAPKTTPPRTTQTTTTPAPKTAPPTVASTKAPQVQATTVPPKIKVASTTQPPKPVTPSSKQTQSQKVSNEQENLNKKPIQTKEEPRK